MDLWGRIAADHAEIRELCRRVSDAEDPNSRDRLFEQLVYELDRYLRAKEEVIYDALERDERTRADAAMAASEHAEIRARLESLARDPSRHSRGWASQLKTLALVLERHFRLEEQGVLVTARGTLDAAEAEELRLAYESAKDAPSDAPSSAVAFLGQPILVVLLGAAAGTAAFLAARAWRYRRDARVDAPGERTGRSR